MTDITSHDDIIDVRDITGRVEELRGDLESAHDEEMEAGRTNLDFGDWRDAVRSDASAAHANEHWDTDNELRGLESLLDDIRGYGGDHQWEGDWYPVTLIRDSYFTEYAMDLLADTGEIPRDIPHYIVIDEEATAANIRTDYSDVEFDGATYWYR
ncbi:hypothetical protein [Burkholderia ubonensis]|uniref:hypothetical protein n=1 Tax=Burkholderia ubonensis TaxID=101571 RepID=UPI00075B9968|nr:hypothetical protein [Burkholderia ubonensis]KWN75018.1 hypothetical protein WM23_26720 [Burkholderia ubonensis]